MLYCPSGYKRFPRGQIRQWTGAWAGISRCGLWISCTFWWAASSNLLVDRLWSRALDTDLCMFVPVFQYCHPCADKTKIQEQAFIGRTDWQCHNPASGLHLQFRFPPLTEEGIDFLLRNKKAQSNSYLLCNLEVLPGVSRQSREVLYLVSFTQGTMVELQLCEKNHC